MNLTRTLDASMETLSLTDVRDHLRITETMDNDALRMFIAGVRHRTEQFLSKTLVTSTWQLKIDAFMPEIELWMEPIQSITSVTYIDTDGAEQTLDSSGYQFSEGGRLSASYGNSWPATRNQYDAVKITYVAGLAHSGLVPADIKHAMLLWVGSCDMMREDGIIGTTISPIPYGAKSILAPHRHQRL